MLSDQIANNQFMVITVSVLYFNVVPLEIGLGLQATF